MHDMHFDIFDPQGLMLGHVDHHDSGDVSLLDALGNPEIHSEMVGNINMLLDNHMRELGTLDPSGIHLANGESYHFESGPLDSASLVSDSHPGDVVHAEQMPDGASAIVDPNYATIAIVRKVFGL